MKPLDSAEVLYIDNHLAIAVKSSGVLTQPDAGKDESLESSVKFWIKNEYQKQGNVFLHAVHRLDRPVSGLVLFARTSKALSRLNEQSRRQEIQRMYVAEIEGMLAEPEGRLDHYLIHGDHRALVAKQSHPDAKHARLYYKTLRRKSHSTIVEIQLETGRYHQIRVQFAAIGHPVFGDKRYGSSVGDGNTIHLHAKCLAFEHPVTHEALSFESPPPFSV